MLSIKSPIVSGLIFAILFLTASTVSADPITAGSLNFGPSSPGSFTISGSGFSASGLTAPLSSSVSLLANGVFFPGGTGSTGGSVDTQDSELVVLLPLTAEGVLHNPASSLLALRFSSSSFTVPVALASGFVVVAPFSLTAGLLEGYPGALGDGTALFSVPLTGQGTTTLTFLSQPGGAYRLHTQTFVFGTTVQEVTVQSIPEPASVLLLVTSLVGLARFRRKRL